MPPIDSVDDTADSVNVATSTISGKPVVIGMLLFGLVLAGFMYWYWNMTAGPYRELTLALAAEFQEAQPRVEGGRHKGGPNTLRIVLRVPFDPETEEGHYHTTLTRILEIAAVTHPVSDYEQIEVHLVRIEEGETLKERSFSAAIADVPQFSE